MTLSKPVKKRIAKEILIFFSGVLIWCLVIAIIYGYNAYEKSTCNRLINQGNINDKKIDSLFGGIYGDSFIPDNITYFNEPPLLLPPPPKRKIDLSVHEDSKTPKWKPPTDAIEVKPNDTTWGENDPIVERNNKGEVILPLPPPHKDYIQKDSLKNVCISKLSLENKEINKELPKHQYSEDLQPTFVIIGILLALLLYPVRFLLLTIRWAFKTVREGND